MADSGLAAVQALVRWDPAWLAERELGERRELGFPPAARMATLTGQPEAVNDLLGLARLPERRAGAGPGAGRARTRSACCCAPAAPVASRWPRRCTTRPAYAACRKAAHPVRIQVDPARTSDAGPATGARAAAGRSGLRRRNGCDVLAVDRRTKVRRMTDRAAGTRHSVDWSALPFVRLPRRRPRDRPAHPTLRGSGAAHPRRRGGHLRQGAARARSRSDRDHARSRRRRAGRAADRRRAAGVQLRRGRRGRPPDQPGAALPRRGGDGRRRGLPVRAGAVLRHQAPARTSSPRASTSPATRCRSSAPA